MRTEKKDNTSIDNLGIRRGAKINDSHNRDEDWNSEEAYVSNYLSFKKKNEVPINEDLIKKLYNETRSKWIVHDQKESLSCIGYAVTDIIYWHFVMERGLNKKNILSARFNWMASKEMDNQRKRPTTFIEKEGSTLKAGLDIAKNYGSVLEEILPMKLGSDIYSKTLFNGTAREFYALAAKLKIESYYNLSTPKEYKKDCQVWIWRSWIAEQGPILVRIKVDSSFENYKSGLLSKFDKDTQYEQHAVIIVGYDKDSFRIRNSWGDEDWGDGGYADVSLEYALEVFDESYGITIGNQSVGASSNNLSRKPIGFWKTKSEDNSFWEIVKNIFSS
jgi:hypothetical protein